MLVNQGRSARDGTWLSDLISIAQDEAGFSQPGGGTPVSRATCIRRSASALAHPYMESSSVLKMASSASHPKAAPIPTYMGHSHDCHTRGPGVSPKSIPCRVRWVPSDQKPPGYGWWEPPPPRWRRARWLTRRRSVMSSAKKNVGGGAGGGGIKAKRDGGEEERRREGLNEEPLRNK